jgi:hypothetical protein
MSAAEPFDPYRSPSLPEGPIVPMTPGRPGWLTALCVVAIVLGALGLINSLMSTAGLLAGPHLQKAMRSQSSPGMSEEMQKAQNKMQDEMYAVQGKYWWPIAIALLLRAGVALLLLIGGIRALGMSEGGRQLLLVAFGVTLPFELAHAILQTMIMLENMTAMHGFAEALSNEMPKDGPPQMGNFIQTVMQGTLIASLVFMYLWTLVKCGLYLWGLLYLRRDRIKALFQPGGAFQPAFPTDH